MEKVDERLGSSASFVGGSGLSHLFLDFIKCQTFLNLVGCSFPVGTPAGLQFFFLHLLRSYGEYFRGFKKYFKCFLLTSPSCSFPQIGVVLVRLVGTDSPFPIPSLYAYWVRSGERVDSGTWLYLSESSVQFFGCPLSKFIM